MLKKMSNFTPSTNASINGTKEVGKTETSADLCTKENLSKIASNLGDEWTKLIPKLGLSQEDAEKFTKDGKTSQGKFIYQEKLFLRQSQPKLYVQIYDLSKRNSFDFFFPPSHKSSKNSCFFAYFSTKKLLIRKLLQETVR